MNAYTVSGTLGKDPQLITTDQGKAVSRFSIWVRTGHDDGYWLCCVAFNEMARRAASYCQGQKIWCVGPIIPRRWTDSNGINREQLQLTCNTLEGGKE